MKAFNCRHQELNGATRLWQAAEKGQHKAVSEILHHPKIDPNKVREDTDHATVGNIAAHHGHVKVVKALLGHSKIRANLGKIDTKASPLFAAAQEGREEVMLELLQWLPCLGPAQDRRTQTGFTVVTVAQSKE